MTDHPPPTQPADVSDDGAPGLFSQFGIPDLPDLPESRPAGDQAALLQKLTDLKREREAATEEMARIVDAIWIRTGDLLTELKRIASREIGTDDETAAAVDRSISAFCRENQLELVHAGGEDVNTLEPGAFDVMSLAPVADAAEHNRVQETFQPLIRHRGRLLRPGRVIVGKIEDSTDSSAQIPE